MFLDPARGSPEAIQGRQQAIQGRKCAATPELMPHGASQLFGLLARIGRKESFKQGIGRLEAGVLARLFPLGERIPPPTGLRVRDGRCAWEWLASGGC